MRLSRTRKIFRIRLAFMPRSPRPDRVTERHVHAGLSILVQSHPDFDIIDIPAVPAPAFGLEYPDVFVGFSVVHPRKSREASSTRAAQTLAKGIA